MKQEANKKSKKWLWIVIGIVLLLAIVGVVLALVLGGGSKDEGPTGGRPELYWNVARQDHIDPETLLSARKPAADGLYYITFAYNGQQVEYPIVDKKLVNFIDTFDVVGLVFDENKVVVDAIDPIEMATEVGKALYVQSVSGNKLIANSSIAMNGMQFKIDITDLTEAYNVSGKGEFEGVKMNMGDLQMMDTITVYANDLEEVTHIYMTNTPVESQIYWRAEAFYSSATKSTTRVPNADGEYEIDFFCEGERVTLKTKDQTIATKIDKADRYKAHFGLRFDEDGYIVEVLNSATATRSVLNCERYDITEFDGMTYTASGLLSNNGDSVMGYVSENTVIYDVSKAAQAENREGKQVDALQMGDRICAWADANGNVIKVYITNRMVESPAYHIPTKMYNSTLKQTTREPDAQGYYEIELLKMGEYANKTYRTNDLYAINRLDSNADQCVGLAFNEDGTIKYVYEAESIFGNVHRGRGYIVTDITGTIGQIITATARDNPINIVLAPNCEIYNVSTTGKYGELTELKLGDAMWGWKQPTGEYIHVHIRSRYVGEDTMYYNVERMWSSSKKVTTRTPDADGWYTIVMAHNGQQVTLKTKDVEIVNKIDSQAISAWSIEVNGDVIVKIHEGTYAAGGQKLGSDYRVVSINGNMVTIRTSAGSEYSFGMSKDVKVYNMCGAVNSHIGEASSLQVGDLVAVYTNCKGEPAFVFIRDRQVDNLYWNKTRMYQSANTGSIREPDENGYYWFDLACNGKEVKVKVKNKWVVDKIESSAVAFGLYMVGDEARGWLSSPGVKDCGGQTNSNWTVTKISGNEVTLTYTIPGSSNTGKTKTVTLDSDVKIYDVTADAENFGAVTKLQVGDLVHTYQNEEKTAQQYVYVRARCTREGGYLSYCEHCDQVVAWTPLIGCDDMSSHTGGHYYLSTDVTRVRTLYVYSTSRDFETVLDLNGHTLYNTKGQAIHTYKNDVLNILDSVGGGKIIGSNDSANGGVLRVSASGTINMYGGTVMLPEDGSVKPASGGCLYVNDHGTFNLYGGSIINGKSYADDNEPDANGKESDYGARGGNVYVSSNGTFNMYGGTVSGGTALDDKVTVHNADGTVTEENIEGYGGNIYVAASATANIYGGTVSGGVSGYYGGNLYCHTTSSKMTVKDATITGGSGRRGGNLYMNGGEVAISGATFTDGVAQFRGGNICAYAGTMTIDGGTKLLNGVAGTEADTGYGGNLSMYSAQVTIGKATIDGGVVPVKGTGGNIYGTYEGTLTINDGAVISNGTSHGNGGNIAINAPELNKTTNEYRIFTLNINGGTFTKGTVVDGSGGNLYVGYTSVKDANDVTIGRVGNLININGGTFTGGQIPDGKDGGNMYITADKLNFSNCTISGGKSGENDYDVYVGLYTNELNISDVNVAGKFRVQGAQEVFNISGAPVMGHLNLNKNVLLTVGEMKEGADVKVNTDYGIFTTAFDNAKTYADADYFSAYKDGYDIEVKPGKKLAVNKIIENLGALVDAGKCPCGCGQDLADVQWIEVSGASAGHYIEDTNVYHFKLTGDYYRSGEARIFQTSAAATLVVDLNGYTLYHEDDKRAALNIGGGATLHLLDTSANGTGTIYGSTVAYNYDSINVTDGSTVNMYGGTILASKGTDRTGTGGSITVGGGCTFNMWGGEINGSDKKDMSKPYGGALRVTSSASAGMTTVNIFDGVINGASNGDAINLSAVTLNVYGGTINGKIAAAADSIVNVGGTAKGKADGAPVIECLNLTKGTKINVEELADSASIGVLGVNKAAFTDSLKDAEEIAEHFHAVNEDYEIVVSENNELVYNWIFVDLGALVDQGKCPCGCGQNLADVQWTELSGASNGHEIKDTNVYHFKLTDDYYRSNTARLFETKAAATVVIDLNGYSLYHENGERIALNLKGGATVHMLDTSANGTGKVWGNSIGGGNAYGDSVIVTGGSTFNMYGGTILASKNDAANRNVPEKTFGSVYVNDGSTFNLWGGEINGSDKSDMTQPYGGAIQVKSGVDGKISTLNVYDGVINGASNGDTIYLLAADAVNPAIINVYGGTINGEVYASENAQVNVGGTCEGAATGAPVIEKLNLTNVKANFAELNENASIGILASNNAVFTQAFASKEAAEAYLEFVHSLKTENQIKVTDANELQFYGEYYCPHCGLKSAEIDWVELGSGNQISGNTSGHFYITVDKVFSGMTLAAESDICIDLRGNDIKRQGSEAYLFSIPADSSLVVFDSIGGGTIKATSYTVRSYGTFKAYNCNIENYIEQAAVKDTTGAILLPGEDSNVELTNCNVLVSNSTYVQGAAIDVRGGTITVTGGTIEGGTVSGNGGAIYLTAGKLTATDCTINGGTAVNGGAIAAGESAEITLNNCTVTAGTVSGQGSALYVPGATLTVNGGSVTGDTVTDVAAVQGASVLSVFAAWIGNLFSL